jgi:hypothetical protein
MLRELIINRSGDVVLDRWDQMFLFSDRYVAFTEKRLDGLYDLKEARVCIPSTEAELNSFNGNLLVARNGDEQHLVDLNGKRLSETTFTRFKGFHDGIAAASRLPADFEKGNFGFLNEAGEWVVEPQFKFLESPTADGLAPGYDRANRFFYVNRHGERQFDRTFEWANAFSEGLAGVKDDGREFYVDTNGETRFEEGEWYHSSPFKHGFALVMSRKLDYHVLFIDNNGTDVFQRAFLRAGDFRNGITPVKVEERWGAIDTTGTVCVTPQFEELKPTLSDLWQAKLNGKYGYVNAKGEWVLEPVYEYAGEVCGDLCKVRVKR